MSGETSERRPPRAAAPAERAAPRPSAAAGGAMGGMGGAMGRAPAFSTPAAFMLGGVLSALLLAPLFVWTYATSLDAYRLNPELLSAVHLFVLGFGSLVALGALHQMIPVVLEVGLYKERIGHLAVALLAPGVAALVIGFWRMWTMWLIVGGLLVAAGAAFALYNLARTLARSEKWNVTGSFIAAALFYLACTIFMGILMAVNLRTGWLSGWAPRGLALHVTLGAVGWFTTLTVGVSYKLLTMFMLVHGLPDRPARILFWLLNVGVVGMAAVSLWAPNSAWIVAPAAAWLAGAIVYGNDLRRMVKRRMRRRVEPGIAFFLLGAATLIVFAAALFAGWAFRAASGEPVGAAIAVEPLLGAALLFALGWVAPAILGMLQKIVPFLVWYHRYSSLVGIKPVPLLREMVNQRWMWAGEALYVAGLWGMSIALAVAGEGAGRAVGTAFALVWAVGLWIILLPVGRLLLTGFAPSPEAGLVAGRGALR